ncbi:MAG: SLC13 family permease [Acidobacteria bacterium]|nr:SLC13 family permease [Acidobacteriota bacterium]
MGWEAGVTLAMIALVLVALARNWAAADIVMVGALTTIIVIGAVSGTDKLPGPAEAIRGFASPGLATVAFLYIVVAGLVHTGAMAMVAAPLLGQPKGVRQAQFQMMAPVAGLSAFLNNTPVVAMFIPVVNDLSKRTGINPSKLMLPLSYAAIFGGICTLIGTSTNLIVNDLLIRQTAGPGLRMFDLAWVGVPCAVVGIGYIVAAGNWLLPDRRPPISTHDDPRRYTVEMMVMADGPLAGKTIEEAGLRQLPGLFLAEIEREGEILPAVGPQERLLANDRLVFVGIVESVTDLKRIRGLMPATDQLFKLDAPQTLRRLIEAVISDNCPVVGRTIREAQFRTRYNAVVIAVARGGRRLKAKIGDIRLQAGDTLLLETHRDFAQAYRNSRDFFLISSVEGSTPVRFEKAGTAFAILGGMVTVAAAGWLDILPAAMLAAGLMVLTRCCTGPEARQGLDWPVLVVIGAAIGLGRALESSGAASAIAHTLINWAGGNPWLTLLAVYVVTMFFTEILTNNAAAVLVFPIAASAAATLEASLMPFAIAIAVAASAGFMTPLGYQTHLMVYGPGGYRFTDFLRVGTPLNLLFLTTALLIIPKVWPL